MINLNLNTKEINWQISFRSSSNSPTTTKVQGFVTQPNSGNVIKEFSGGATDSLRPSKRELNWWIQNLNLYRALIIPPAQINISLDASNKG